MTIGGRYYAIIDVHTGAEIGRVWAVSFVQAKRKWCSKHPQYSMQDIDARSVSLSGENA